MLPQNAVQAGMSKDIHLSFVPSLPFGRLDTTEGEIAHAGSYKPKRFNLAGDGREDLNELK